MSTFLFLAMSLLWVTVAHAQDRLALVIGNSNYSSVSPLDNPTRDAQLIATTLQSIDFEVTLLIDATQEQMNRALSQFGRSLREKGPDTTGLFYYAGHGVQSFGSNYLLPVDVSLRDAADLDLEGVEAQSVLRQMASARNRTNFVILDACRNNPFENIAEFDDPGLAEMKAPTGTFLAYATAPGAVALDGTGQNSPFTTALAQEMVKPGLAVEQVFKQVRVSVLDKTAGQQTPWDTSSLTSNFQFVNAPAEDPEALAARQLWESVQATRDPVQIMLFLRGYPGSVHANEARELLAAVIEEELTSPEPQAPAAVTAGPSAEEQQLFETAQSNPTVAGYQAYLDSYPTGTFAEFAKQEIAALSTNTGADPVGEGVTEEEENIEVAAVQERAAAPNAVTFGGPLQAPGSPIDGVSIADLFDMSPQFPPIPELPEELWKSATCASCHEWNRDRLCEQSNNYLTLSGQKSLEKPHPFDGALKRNLRQWAAGGCQ
ncbi:caspase family protein [Marivita sp. S6314]|uniref:caspase family protein n=1 Tax=Marivita sp. S6314 TaxID=2926406 RepID=UPI001FF52E1A|nr:caspase family protein [Marivita sp. S6314]MCK0149310.1 caspase family protein [Marivita sp. S6314]